MRFVRYCCRTPIAPEDFTEEEFIVANFDTIFKGELRIYKDAEAYGQQYVTDIGQIDILAVERASSSFVVLELKKGRPSDQVGWSDSLLHGLGQEESLQR